MACRFPMHARTLWLVTTTTSRRTFSAIQAVIKPSRGIVASTYTSDGVFDRRAYHPTPIPLAQGPAEAEPSLGSSTDAPLERSESGSRLEGMNDMQGVDDPPVGDVIGDSGQSKVEEEIDSKPVLLPSPPLLPLPSPPPASSNPLTDATITKYLLPLYTRRWALLVHKSRSRQQAGSKTVAVPKLSKSFRFKDAEAAVDFLRDVGKFSTEEKHSPTFVLSRDYIHLDLYTEPLPSSSSAILIPPEPGHASITDTDLRLALLIEQHYTAHYVVPGVSSRTGAAAIRPTSLAQLEAELAPNMLMVPPKPLASLHPSISQDFPKFQGFSWNQRQLKPPTFRTAQLPRHVCPCCAGPHKLAHCSVRFTKPPPSGCFTCGGNHWVVDCPVPKATPQNRDPRKHRARCPSCRGLHALIDCATRFQHSPTKPCIFCGGQHWRVDCPKVTLKEKARVPDANATT